MSIADDSFRFCEMFEGELLTELMLRHWEHPLAEDMVYRSGLIENAAKAIRMSMDGERLVEGLQPSQMNFVAAVWYAEWAGLQSSSPEIPAAELHQREGWLEAVRRAVPSCFCDQEDLPE
jgi:hypothetical protein